MPAPADGYCDQRFAAVRAAFGGNFAERGELGAAVCVLVDGRVVADLWGGWADVKQGRTWQPDTLVNVFSVGKGAGGSLGFCDPEPGLAFGYVMNQMGPRWQNPRTRALVDAVYACL